MRNMRNRKIWSLAAVACMLAFAGCKDDEYDNKSPFDNVAYLNVSENSDTQVTTFKKTLATLQKVSP